MMLNTSTYILKSFPLWDPENIIKISQSMTSKREKLYSTCRLSVRIFQQFTSLHNCLLIFDLSLSDVIYEHP